MATKGKGKDREESTSAAGAAVAGEAHPLSSGSEDVACRCLNVRLSARTVQGDGSSSGSASSEDADSVRIQVTQDSYRVVSAACQALAMTALSAECMPLRG